MERLFAPWRHAWVTSAAAQSDGAASGGGRCLFCLVRDASADEQNLVVHRAKGALLMLNRYPYNGGHLLVVPEEHRGALQDLSPDARAAVMELSAQALFALDRLHHPDGFNLGVNQGRSGGAGVPDHVHMHIVPRWNGDTNFMTTVADTRVVSQDLPRLREELAAYFAGERPR